MTQWSAATLDQVALIILSRNVCSSSSDEPSDSVLSLVNLRTPGERWEGGREGREEGREGGRELEKKKELNIGQIHQN